MSYKSKYTGLQIDDLLDSVESKQGKIEDLESIRAGAQKGATALQSYTEKYTGTVTGIKINGETKSGSGVIDLGTIESKTLTESDIAAMGFTKNVGTYSKPSGGIPKSDLASAVQTSLGKADTAVQPDAISEFVTIEDLAGVASSGSYNDLTDKPYIPNADSVKTWGFVKGVKLNGSTKTPSVSDGIVDLGTISGGGGGSSSGSGAYPEVDGSRYGSAWSLGNYEIYDMQPNTFYVFPACVSLYIQFADETVGVANEYLFQFTSGTTATTLTLPNDIKWANDSAPTIAENKIYQVSILKGLASVLEFSNVNLISFAIEDKTYIAEDGMTWQEWVNSSYNGNGYAINGSLVIWSTNYVGLNYSAVSLSDLITPGANYEHYNNEPV